MDKFEQVVTSLLAEVPGATMAALLGRDGVGVHVVLSEAWEDMAPDVLEVELAALADGVQRAVSGLDVAMSPDFFLGTAQANFVGAMLDPSYFLVVGLEPSGDLAQAREALAEAQESLLHFE